MSSLPVGKSLMRIFKELAHRLGETLILSLNFLYNLNPQIILDAVLEDDQVHRPNHFMRFYRVGLVLEFIHHGQVTPEEDHDEGDNHKQRRQRDKVVGPHLQAHRPGVQTAIDLPKSGPKGKE